jgi:hypothetical protein
VRAFGAGGSHGTPRRRGEIERIFDGFELVEPGLV